MPALLAQNAPQSLLVQLLLPVGLGLIATGLIFMLRKRSRTGGAPSARAQLERVRNVDGMKDDLQALMVEIERMTRRFASQVEAKTTELEALIAEAEQRIAELRELRDATADAAALSPSTRGYDPGPPSDAPALNPPPADDDAPTGPSLRDELSVRVLQLADEGHDAQAIARELDEHVGKIELILALRQA